MGKHTNAPPPRKVSLFDHQFTKYFLPLSAEYWRDGVYAPEDWRYSAMVEFLLNSPSFLAVREHIKGDKPRYPLPKDFESVRKVVEDFMDINEDTDRLQWWRSGGKYLFGQAAPAPKVYVLPQILTSKNKSLTMMWDRNDAVVLRVALSQSKAEALEQIKTKFENLQFQASGPTEISAKYQFMGKGPREATLEKACTALWMSSPHGLDYPLWLTGSNVGAVPGQTIKAKEFTTMDPGDLAERKRILTIAVSRLIRIGNLVAENAARGRFPCIDPFPEAQLTIHKKKIGRSKTGSITVKPLTSTPS